MRDQNRLVVVLTDRHQARRPLADVVAEAARGGADRVVLREKDLDAGARARLAAGIRDRLPDGCRLVVASDVVLARRAGAAGVHLAAADPWPPHGDLGAGGARLLVGRSCHDLAELREARWWGADDVTLSPVLASASKPGYGPLLGVGGLGRLCAAVPDLPVVALGGISAGEAGACVVAGAAGVALMGTVMRAGDPAGVVGAVRAAVDGAPRPRR